MSRPLRILHVVSHMDPIAGGAETWLMDVFRRIDRGRFRFDFLVHTPDRMRFHDEIEALGGRLLRADRPIKLWKYGRTFRRLVAEHGPYDVCHVHVPYCGYAIHLARTAGIPHRVAHAHQDSYAVGYPWPVRRFLAHTNPWVARDATAGMACSRAAAAALYGPAWETDPRWRLLYYGIDLTRFQGEVDGAALRRGLGLPDGAFVLGHVGRFAAQKNHPFLLEIAAEVMTRRPDTWLVLVGDGDARPRVEARARALRIADRVVFAGIRNDVPELLRGVFGVVVFPSLFEGLPLFGLEAQAAGRPLVYSDAISTEFLIPSAGAHAVGLSSPPSEWAEHVLACQHAGRPAAEMMPAAERFSIDRSARHLGSFYETACSGRE